MKVRSRAAQRGFTLIEMLIVISMVLILLSIALPMYNQDASTRQGSQAAP